MNVVVFHEISGVFSVRLPFGFFLPAAMVAAWYGGFGPGLLAAFLGLLRGDYFFLPPHSAWGPLGDAERTAITIYPGTAVLLDNLHTRVSVLQCRLKRASRPEEVRAKGET
jgi:K+-sensing histidine kinase KdpD